MMTVNVCLITYNHEEYIAQAIESILNQEGSFRIRVIIGEDWSKDNTRAICKTYAEKHPDIIQLLPNESNLGMMKNFLRTREACDGKYIAFLEGDDYWTDPLKLQKQVDFLEANPDYCLCFHNVIKKKTRNNNYGEWPFHASLERDVFTTDDLLTQWFIPSGSVLFVNYPDFVLPDWFVHCKSGDIPFLLLISLRGKIKYIDEIMGVYRIHDAGVSTTHIGYEKIIAMIYIYENFNIYTRFKYHKKIREAIIHEITYHLPRNEEAKQKANNNTILSRIYRKIKSAT
jgi:glycosyltransferase involved in cell wall biosynthesis